MASRGTFRAIADDLRRQVQGGMLPGALVPSEMALVEQYEVSRGTVRSALALLVQEGLIEVVPGLGRRVVGEPNRDGTTASTTAYARIAAELRERIDAGEFPPHSPMPSEADLVAQYNVSRNTARRAYRQLVEAGVVVVRHGAGAFRAPR